MDYGDLLAHSAEHTMIYFVMLFGIMLAILTAAKVLYHLWRGITI